MACTVFEIVFRNGPPDPLRPQIQMFSGFSLGPIGPIANRPYLFLVTGPPRQATGPPRSGAGVGVGVLRGTTMFEDLKDSKQMIFRNTKIPPCTINYSKSIEVFSKLF